MIKKQMAILILTMFISSQIIIGNSMAENTNEILIESDVTWTEDHYIDGNIRILNGGKLTIIDSEISFSTESKTSFNSLIKSSHKAFKNLGLFNSIIATLLIFLKIIFSNFISMSDSYYNKMLTFPYF